jgi:hypothetical protein
MFVEAFLGPLEGLLLQPGAARRVPIGGPYGLFGVTESFMRLPSTEMANVNSSFPVPGC